MPDHNQMLQWSPGLPFVPNGSDFGNRGVFNEQPLPSPQAQQQQIEALAKQLAQVQQQPAPAAPAPAPTPQAPPVDTTPRPNAWSMANFTSDQDTPVGTDYRAGNIPYQWFQPQPAGQLQPGQGGVQPPPTPPAPPPPPDPIPPPMPTQPDAGGMPSFGPGDVSPLGGAVGGDPAGAGPSPGVQGMAAALSGQPSGETSAMFGQGNGAGGFLSPQPAPPPDPGVAPTLPNAAPDMSQAQQMAMALMGDQNGQSAPGGLGQATGAQNDSMVGGVPDQAMQSAFGTDVMGAPAPAMGEAFNGTIGPGMNSMPESKSPNVGMTANMGLNFSDQTAPQNNTTPSNAAWGGTVTNVAGVPTGLQPGQPAAPTKSTPAAPTTATTQVGVPAATVMNAPTQQVAAPNVGLNTPSAADYGGQSDPQGPAGAGNPGAATSPDQDQNGGLGAGSTAGMGVGMGMAATGTADGISGGEHGQSVGANGGGDGSGGNGSGANGVGNGNDAGSGTAGAGQSGEGGQWALGGIIPGDGDALNEAVPNQTLHEDEGVVNPGGMELLGADFITELNAIALDEKLDDEAKADAAKDLFERLAAGDMSAGEKIETGDDDLDESGPDDPEGAVPPGTMAQAPKPLDPKRKLAMAMMPQRPPMGAPMGQPSFPPQQGMMG